MIRIVSSDTSPPRLETRLRIYTATLEIVECLCAFVCSPVKWGYYYQLQVLV